MRRKYTILFYCLLLALVWTAGAVSAQMTFTTGAGLTQTQNFNGMTGTALPSGFLVNGVNTVTATATSLTGTSTGATYKFISGSDNAIGILNSGGFTAPKTIVLQMMNNTGSTIVGFNISFNYEKYRTGSRAWTWSFTGSGGTVTGGGLSYVADAANTTSIFPPQQTAATAAVSGITLTNGSTYTLTWTLTGAGGSTNGQALGIDDLSITALIPSLSANTLSDFGNVCINSTAGPAMFTITGTNLTNQSVTIGALAGYTFSTTAAGTYSSSLSIAQTGGSFSRNIYVTFSPTAVQSYDGNISIGGGGVSASIDLAATGNGVALPEANATSNSPLCEGSDLQLDASGSTGNGPLTYTWSGPATYSSTDIAPLLGNVTVLQKGNYSVTVTDANNCSASQSVSVVIDSVIKAPANVTAQADAGICTASGVTLGTPIVSANCTVTDITNDAPAVFNVGTTIVTWSAKVGATTFTVTQTVTVNDTQNPTITAPSDVTVNADAGVCIASGVTLGSPVTADNCSVAIVTNDAPTSFNTGATTITWTVTDASGNTATATQTVTVNDTQNPTITAPSNVTVSTDAGVCTASGVTLGTPVTADNCSVSTVTNDAPTSFNTGTTTVTWTVTDASGNTSTATQTVTVNSNIVPEVSITANPSLPLCVGTAVTFTATPVNGGTTPSYEWKLNGSSVGTASTYTSSSLANNDQLVCVMTSDISCANPASASSSVTITTTVCAGIETEKINNNFLVYPNPSNGEIDIEFNSSTTASIAVLDMLGKVKYEGRMDENKKRIDLGILERGMYIICIMDGSQKAVKLITIE